MSLSGITPMSLFVATSSSEEELSVFSNSLNIDTSTPLLPDDNAVENNKSKLMLKLILEAVQTIPSENETKGISIQKIKHFLKKEHHVRKSDIQRQLRPALESAIKRKMLLKTAGRTSVLIGSVKLNTAYREVQEKPAPAYPEDSLKDPTAEEKQAEARKRKAGVETESAHRKRRK